MPEKPACLRLTFDGEVSAGKSFLREIGGDLIFRLNHEVTAGGWFIEVVPKTQKAEGQDEYVWVVTPPYHFGNPRYLDTSYGISPQEAVQRSPREFNFVLDHEQYDRAAQLVDLALSPPPVSANKSQQELDREAQESVDALMSFPVAKGKLWILDSRVTPSAAKNDSGSIDWIKFKVELLVPCGFPVAAGTGQITVDSAACVPK